MRERKEGRRNRLVVADTQWAQSLPGWLLDQIEEERMTAGFAALLKDDRAVQPASDAEVVAYLYTASLKAPMKHEHAQIYLYLASKVMAARGKDVPKDAPKELSESEKHELSIIRQEITRKRGRVTHPLLEVLEEIKAAAEESSKRRAA